MWNSSHILDPMFHFAKNQDFLKFLFITVFHFTRFLLLTSAGYSLVSLLRLCVCVTICILHSQVLLGSVNPNANSISNCLYVDRINGWNISSCRNLIHNHGWNISSCRNLLHNHGWNISSCRNLLHSLIFSEMIHFYIICD